MSRREPTPIKNDPSLPKLWTSLAQKNDPGVGADPAQEFLPGAVGDVVVPTEAEKKARLSRRGFLGFGAASAALLSEACIRRPVDKILPYTKAPEQTIPGVSYHYATVLSVRGEALGVLAESHEGRPTKIEGNPDHPASAGGASLIAQAAIMDLYDPDRSNAVRRGGKKLEDSEEFDKVLSELARSLGADAGKVRVLMPPTTSPTVLRLRKAIREKYPHLRFHTWAPVSESNQQQGLKAAFGQAMRAVADYSARVILSLDCDFLQTEQGSVRAAKAFAKGRRVEKPADADRMTRLYAIESVMTVTGSNADHRLRLPASRMDAYLRALANELASAHGVELGPLKSTVAGAAPTEVPEKWIKLVAKELAAHKGQSVIAVGRHLPAHVHALAAVLNDALANGGKTVAYAPAADPLEPADLAADLKALVDEASSVETLLILGGNPVYDAPSDLGFEAALAKIKTSIHLSDRFDETSEKCTWHVPMAHALESWGDARGVDGTWSIRQPLIAPLHGGRSDIEVLAVLAGEAPKGYEAVRKTFKESAAIPAMFDAAWSSALQRGAAKQSATLLFAGLKPNLEEVAALVAKAPVAPPLGAGAFEVVFVPCAKLHDGAHANNPWLLELPDPMTKIVWDNAALVSPKTAKDLGLAPHDVLSVTVDGGKPVEIAAWTLPGMADGVVALPLGWGRRAAGRYGNGRGFDVYPARTSKGLGFASARVAKVSGKTHDLVQTQEHHSMEGRPIALDVTVAEYKSNPLFAKYKSPTPRTLPLWNPVEYTGYKWGMSIDLNACTGCSACIVACQVENNIHFVGKDQVYRGREMLWLRVDRYFVGDSEDDPQVAFQPVACVQCEEAPCENVCPVNATAHGPEGLNDMAYNRCIGTRYCANNCPYKVRRFNYLNWRGEMYGEIPETEKMAFNPNVTVRMRGVMEKCTYCVQRIEEAKIDARRTGGKVESKKLLTACQQTCPADAIVFGDLNDPNAKVTELQKSERGYALLAELGTHPRTLHLGRIRNPNPEMGEAKAAAAGAHKEGG
jgi:molybdopterin-containing oxidoreductase family iron-sulfur binding subunit